MAKRQTRRTISVRGELYETVAQLSLRTGVPQAAYFERAVLAALDADGVTLVSRDAWLDKLDRIARRREERSVKIISQRFTF